MKLNIINHPEAPSRDGFKNITLEHFITGDEIPRSACTDILLLNGGINALDIQRLQKVWEALRHGGTLQISGVDALALSAEFYLGKLTIAAFSDAVRGAYTMYTVDQLSQIFQQQGFHVTRTSLDGILFNITVRRP